jgi:hypothetical protein
MSNFVAQSIEYLLKSGVTGAVEETATGPCIVCKKQDSVMNSHHTVPQSCGGEKSLQVSLCASHHDILHACALSVLAAKKKNSKISKQFWKTEQEERNAQPLLNVLLQSLQLNKDSKEAQNRNIVSINLNQMLKQSLKLLSKDLNLSQDKALIYSLIYTLNQKGILNEENFRRQLSELR